MHPSEHAAKVIESAILEIRDQSVPLYTFALYYDHESDALSVCADTKENSARTVRRVNSYNARHFRRAIVDGDLATARMWHSNVGRSLSLGDFALVNVGRLELQGTNPEESFFVDLLRTLAAYESQLRALAPEPEDLILACSGVAEEVAYVWAPPSDV
jgi:hypothetical protein